MRRIAAVSLALIGLFVTGCSAPSLVPTGASSNCADLVARAMTSPNKPVAGAYACFDSHDPNMGAALTNASITDDASLAAFAGTDPVYTSATHCQHKADGYSYYELHGASGSTQVMRIKVGTTGKVSDVRFRGVGSTCADA